MRRSKGEIERNHYSGKTPTVLDDGPNSSSPSDSLGPRVSPMLGIAAMLLTIYSWMLTAVIVGGQWLLGNGWPGALRENVSLGVTFCLTLFVATVCRGQFRALRQLRKKGPIVISAGQAWWVILIVLGAGAYGTWLVCVP
jgi:hypothetical protein